MPTAVVTGGAGFLGSHLCDHLLAHDYRVICVDNLQTSTLRNLEHIRSDAFVFLYHDVIDPIEIDGDVDFVYHLAALASPIDYLRMPLHSLKVGSYGTHNALGLAKWKRARFLLASTSEVYGDPQVHPQPETYWGNVNPIGPRGVYDEAKRYGEAMTMAYHGQQGVDTAIARIFNSILADEQVLYDDGRELRRETVADAASRLASFAVAAGYVPRAAPRSLALLESFSPAVEYPLSGFRVPAFALGGQMVSARVSSLIAHPTSERCVEINMFDVWSWCENDPWRLGIEAAGLGERAWKQRYDVFGSLVSERRNNGPNWRNGAWTKLIRMRRADRVPLPVLRLLGEPLPDGARVRVLHRGRSVSLPARITITDDLLWLLGLWVAEGSWHESSGNAFLTISGDRALLDRAASVVRRDLGLHVVDGAASPSRSASIFIHSSLLIRLMEYLGFAGNRKRIPGWILGLPLSRLKWFLEGYREGDGVHSGAKFRDGTRHEFSTIHDELKDDLIVAFARFGLLPSVGRNTSRLRAKTGERVYPFWRLTLAHVSPWSPLEWDRGVEQRLQARCTGDLVWAAVREIRDIPSSGLVYDFAVPGLENFWAGTGVLAHNTYGPRMRPNDGRAVPTFVRQALEGKPLTVFGDGTQTRSFCYVEDLIRGLVLLAESGEHLPVNLGNPAEFTLNELAETVLRVTGAKSEIVYEALPVDDPQVRQPDITRARQLLGWEPEIELEEGLRRMLPTFGPEPVVV